jgi:calcium binding protein 39
MACIASPGSSMFARFFRNDKACQPDVSFSELLPHQGHDLVQHLLKSLTDAVSEPSALHMKRLRSCLQAALDRFESETTPDVEHTQLLASILAADLPAHMLSALPAIEFEAQKDIMRLFRQILQAGSMQVIEYVLAHNTVLQVLISGCGSADGALQCHEILRACSQHPQLAQRMLEAGFATDLLELARHQTFEIASDAFTSLRELMLTHRQVTAAYLEANFHAFFVPYNRLLEHADYVTKRQALRLLGEILLDRNHKRVLRLYVAEEQFLQVQMNLLRDNSRAVQIDAFQVFKVFAACPGKTPRVQQILVRNRERLVKLLGSLGKQDDEGFQQDQKAVIEALWMLKAAAGKN